MKKTKLTPKQKRFVAEYLKDQNGTQAAIRAGYKKSSANAQASRLLTKSNIMQLVEKKIEKVSADSLITAEFVINGLKQNALRCQQAVPVMEFDPVDKRMVHKMASITDKDGKEREVGVYEFDSSGSNRAFELLGRTMGIFIDKKEVKEESGDIIINVVPVIVNKIQSSVDRPKKIETFEDAEHNPPSD